MVRMTLTTARTGEPTASDPDAVRGSALGAALAGPLVSTQWLCDHLGSDGLVVIDASVVPVTDGGRTSYASGR